MDAVWRFTLAIRGQTATPEAGMLALALGQYGVVARWQLLLLGMSSAAIDRRLSTGRLYRLHLGVYAVGRPDVPLRGRWLAAVLACGHGAVLSHRTAGALWGLGNAGPPVHVTNPGARGRCDAGIALHRTRSLPPSDVALGEAIPVTSLPRTLVDLAGVLDADGLRDAFEEADRLNLLELRAVAEACRRANGRRGVGELRALVREAKQPDLARSTLERRFRHFCRRHGLPAAETNAHVEGFEIDALWRAQRLIVELDSWDFHGRTRAAFELATPASRSPGTASTASRGAGWSGSRARWRPSCGRSWPAEPPSLSRATRRSACGEEKAAPRPSRRDPHRRCGPRQRCGEPPSLCEGR